MNCLARKGLNNGKMLVLWLKNRANGSNCAAKRIAAKLSTKPISDSITGYYASFRSVGAAMNRYNEPIMRVGAAGGISGPYQKHA